ncbi:MULTISPECIES: response regulator transcription factor [unclassified Fusibacter]|uniref:response regulator transcription factor n=1 Tax=unclassified Fusibacter TaxID=2624464 RepID=UPI001012857E|nr:MULTISPECIES: response regulator transcription factor [unclassified Fusibacter]MCK8060900.1 response regulator transcription factor [Fusibacter sp. A2]NPE23196.1 response regulator transcription factor [Fusibacter sp. A1]RXV59554.1 DNA-binding response regulator [Fusibacter sp. A1]
MSYSIWIVEDEKSISDIIKAYLEKESYSVTQFMDGLSAMNALEGELPSLMILDINLPIYGGQDILKKLRESSDLPVIMLTSLSDEVSRIKGFELGVDDYVTKPYSNIELVHRVKRILIRTYGKAEQLKISKELYIDTKTYELFFNDNRIDLTTNEVRVLMTLVKEKGRVLSREQVIELTFGYAYEATPRNIDTYIKNIRQKIEIDPKSPEIVRTKYGIGYYYGGGL